MEERLKRDKTNPDNQLSSYNTAMPKDRIFANIRIWCSCVCVCAHVCMLMPGYQLKLFLVQVKKTNYYK